MTLAFKDAVLLTVTGNPGTGDIVSGGAITHYLNMVAGDDGKTFDLTIYDCDSNGNLNGSVEIIRDVVFVWSTTTFSRNSTGTVVSSTTGSKINFGSGTQRIAVSAWNGYRSVNSIQATGIVAFTSDQSMGSHKLTNVTDPTNPQEVATKNYTDTAIATAVAALAAKQDVQAATTTALAAATYNNGSSGVGATLTLNVAAVLIIDGYTPALNDRLLIKNQASAVQNGIYTLTTVGVVLGSIQAVLTRSTDFNQPGDGINGALVYVLNGTTNANTLWSCTTDATIVFNTTNINWFNFQGATYTADGTTLTLTGTTFSITSGGVGTTQLAAGAVTEAKQTLADNTTANVTTSAHGYAPKAPNDTGKFLQGDATWATPKWAINFLVDSSFSLAPQQVVGTYTAPTYNNVVATAGGTDGYGAALWKAGFQTATLKYKTVDTNGAQETGLQCRKYGAWQQQTGAGKFILYQILEGSTTYDIDSQIITFQILLKASASKTIRLGLVQLNSSGTMDTIPGLMVPTTWGAASTDPTLGTNLARVAPSSVPTGGNGTVNGNAVDCAVTTAWQLFAGTFTMPANAVNIMVALWTDSQFSTNDILYTAQADLHLGSYTRSWTPRLPADEIQGISRFCIGWGGTALYERIGSGTATVNNSGNGLIVFPVTMRVSPVIGYNSISNLGAYDQRTGVVTTLTSLSADSTGNNTHVCNYDFGVSSVPFNAGDVCPLVTNNTTAAIFYLDSRM